MATFHYFKYCKCLNISKQLCQCEGRVGYGIGSILHQLTYPIQLVNVGVTQIGLYQVPGAGWVTQLND